MRTSIGFTLILSVFFTAQALASDVMTPEKLWQVKRVSPVGLSLDKQQVVYKVTTPDIAGNGFNSQYYRVPVVGGDMVLIDSPKGLVKDRNLSADGTKRLMHQDVALQSVLGSARHDDLALSNEKHDIMPDEPYSSPQSPFGGEEDYVWGPKGENIYYVSKKYQGNDYVVSTNTDIYQYNLASKKTTNITEGNLGYDTSPAFSSKGQLAWLQMKTPGYEADKNDIIVMHRGKPMNLTAQWDGSVRGFLWADAHADKSHIFFTAATAGTVQLFRVDVVGDSKKMPVVEQLTQGQFDVNDIVAATGEYLVLTRSSMNAAKEIFRFDLDANKWQALTTVNNDMFAALDKPTVKERRVKTKDGQDMLVWVVYPPNFDESKKYPTLLYAQGGPQSPLSQFYSYRWNFQVMASQGYIIVAPNRRGMPGHGIAWNEAISKDWGGNAIQDYLDAIDDIAKESYVDNERLGAIGASFGGYSVFQLAAVHNKRFKTFISHDGVFDFRSMYGTTEELFFVNHDIGGPYWDKDNAAAQKSYQQFNPSNFVAKWDTPMLVIHGGRDYRVPLGQGIQAYQAAQLLGLKSRFLYFPEENHWVLSPQNGLVWQREFFRWLDETL
jgi:dipeptidyl aminopeptidase/acylaminoacyl peptidase